jgi:amino acid adenylation domain-containing protein
MRGIFLSSNLQAAANQNTREREYWYHKLKQEIPKSYFPYDRLGEEDPKQWDCFNFQLGAEACKRLKELTRGIIHTYQVYLMSGIFLLLHKYTGQDDLQVAVPLNNQTQSESYPSRDKEAFINSLLVLRIHTRKENTFREILLEVRDTLLEALKNQNFPFQALPGLVGIEYQDGDFPLFDVSIKINELHKDINLNEVAHNTQFSFEIKEHTITGKVSWSKAKYRKTTIENITRHFAQLMNTVLLNPDLPITAISLLTSREKHTLLEAFNNTSFHFPKEKSIPEFIRERSLKNPDSYAVIATLDLAGIYQYLNSTNPEERIPAELMQEIKPCVFAKNPFIFETNLEEQHLDREYRILKTHRHNSVILDIHALQLLNLFDGQITIHNLYLQLKTLLQERQIETHLITTVAEDVLEISYEGFRETRIIIDHHMENLLRFVQKLYQHHLINLKDITSGHSSQGKPKKIRPFKFHESPIRGIVWDQLLKMNNRKHQASVLLLGDTTGMATTGLLYLASYLRRNSITACCRFYEPNRDYKSMKANILELLDTLKPKIVAISMKWFLHIARVLEICRIIKSHSPKINVVLGGNTASFYPEEIIKEGNIDFLVCGDGEEPLLEICRNQYPVRNSIYKKDGKWVKNKITYLENEKNGSEIYLSHLEEILVATKAPVFGSFFIYTHRGCGMNCLYCGGCKQAHKKAYNRTGLYRRHPREVRKDIQEAKGFTSTFFFDFDFPNQQLITYCKEIWEGIDLSSHFCVLGNLIPPSPELIRYVSEIFKYVYWNLDMASLSERHRMELYKKGKVKYQPTDQEIQEFFQECEQYDNVEVRINLIAGLPCFTEEDIRESEELLDSLLENYTRLSELHWARLHAQPGAPIIEKAGHYKMVSHANTYEDFLKFSRENFEKNDLYPGLEHYHYPYIYYQDDNLNSIITKHYIEINKKIQRYTQDKREHPQLSKKITFRELDRKANLLADQLKKRGAGPRSISGIMADRNLGMVIGILGILKSGGAYLPLDPGYPDTRIQYLLKDSGTRILITENTHLQKIKEIKQSKNIPIEYICIDEEGKYNEKGSKPEILPEPISGNPAYLIYTSGTSGYPKGVLVNHRAVVNYTLWRLKTYLLGEEDITLQLISLCFDGFGSNFYSSLFSGGRLVMVPDTKKLDLEYARKVIHYQRVTNTSVVPGVYEALLQYARKRDFDNMRFVVLAGEKAKEELIKKSIRQFPGIRLINEYGPTETTVTAVASIEMKESNPGVIGKPIFNSRIYILDRNQQPVPIGVKGEIYIGGTGLARGYLNAPQLTREKFIKNPLKKNDTLFRTGDMGRWQPKGEIEFSGRADQQFKIRGYRIEPTEIENQINQHPQIREAKVLERKYTQEGREKGIWAYIVYQPQKTGSLNKLPESEELKTYLSKALPDYMVPSGFIPIEKIPLTPHGKVDHAALLKMERIPSHTYIAPRDEIEKNMTEIWQEVLKKRKPIGIEDNFFDLGGHSLKTMALVTRIHRKFHLKIPQKEIFKLPTIKQLSHYLKKETQKFSYTSILQAEEKEYYPLTPAQKGLYLLQKVEPGNTSFNMPVPLRLEGRLKIHQIEELLKKLISRHQSLRTTFQITDEEPVQAIKRDFQFKIKTITATERTFIEILPSLIQPFDLSQAPILRAYLINITPKKDIRILVVDTHHIITDGISQSILTREFQNLYNGKDLARIQYQYKDYTQWMMQKEQKRKREDQAGYWLQQFRGRSPEITLPFDIKPGTFREVVEKKGRRQEFQLTEEVTHHIGQIAQQQGTTQFIVLLAIFKIFLSKINRQKEIVVGTPVSGRTHKDLEGIIGMFVNMLALKSQITGQKTFYEFLEQITQNTLQAFENQDYPFEELVEKTGASGEIGKNPLFNVVFVFQDILQAEETREKGASGTLSGEIPVQERTPKFDLTLTAYKRHHKLNFSFEYSDANFREETIRLFLRYFQHLMNAIIQSTEISISRIELIPEEEKKRLMQGLDNASICFPKQETVPSLFREEAEKHPRGIALSGESLEQGNEYKNQVTYQELGKRATQISRALLEEGNGANRIAAIHTEPTVEMVMGILGILESGMGYLPIHPTNPEKRIQYLLEDSSAEILLIQSGNSKKIPYKGKTLNLNSLESTKENHQDTPKSLSGPQDLAYIIYTSGTTGRPKGVMISHRNVVRLLFNEQFPFEFSEKDVWTLFHSYSFDFSVWEMFGALLNGGKLIILPRDVTRDTARLLEHLGQEKITVLNQTPSAFYNIIALETGEFKPPQLRLRYVVFGGEALEPARLKSWRERYPGTKLVNMYGITETTVHVTYKEIREKEIDEGISCIGKPIPTLKLQVMDQDGNLSPANIPGELAVGGEGVGIGYLNKPELTQEKFEFLPRSCKEWWYRSGDLVKIDYRGELEYHGRIDDQVKVRGFRIELEEIENQLLTHKEISAAAVALKGKSTGTTSICAYIIPREPLKKEKNKQEQDIKKYLAERLPDYMVPQYINPIDQIPLTPNGKIDREALPLPDNLQGNQLILPGNETEKKLANIWNEVLYGKDFPSQSIEKDDNFFQLGGHSLKAALITAKIQQEFQVKLPIKEIFNHQTIRELSAVLQDFQKIRHIPPKPVEKKEYYPLTPSQKRFYLLYQLQPEKIGYNMPQVLEFRHKPEKAEFNRVFQELIQRHESLRTTFEMVEGKPVQRIHDTIDFKVEERNLNGNPGTGIAEKLLERNFLEFIKPFKLEQLPLIRAGILRMNSERNFLMLDMHHIITDGVSQALLTEEFIKEYSGEPLPDQELQYKEVVEWHMRPENQKALQKQGEFWKNQFKGENPVINLPLDFPRPKVQGFEGDLMGFELQKGRAKSLKTLCQNNDVTQFMLLLAVYQVFLWKISDQKDIVVGIPVANRKQVELQGIMGLFVNTLALKKRINPGNSFIDYLKEVKHTVLEAFENQGYPYEELVETVVRERDLSHNPLFDVMMVWQHQQVIQKKEKDNENKYTGIFKENENPMGHRISKFDLTLNVLETVDSLNFSFEYSTKCFKKDTIKRFIEYYRYLLNTIIKTPDICLSEMQMIPDRERHTILYGFNRTDQPYPENKKITELFEEQIEKIPHQIAITGHTQEEKNREIQLTRKEFKKQTIEIALILKEKGLQEGSIAALLLDRTLEMIISIFGVLKSGGAWLPIETSYPKKRVEYLLEDSRAFLLITHKENIHTYITPTIFLGKEKRGKADIHLKEAPRETRSHPRQLAYIIYTSGTTGNPKGVMIEHPGLENRLKWMQKHYPMGKTDTILQKTRYTFDVSVWEILLWAIAGTRVSLLKPGGEADLKTIARTIFKHKITCLHFVPSVLSIFLDYLKKTEIHEATTPKHKLYPKLRQVICSGEALKKSQVDKFYQIINKNKKIKTKLANLYGPTEATIDVTSYDIQEKKGDRQQNWQQNFNSIPIGKPINNTKVYVCDEQLNIQPIGIPGELYLSGVQLGKGYLNQPLLTHHTFKSNPFSTDRDQKIYKTGDRVRWLQDGNLEYLGRNDHQVKIRGMRIETGEIEHQLVKHPGITEAVVIARESHGLIAYIVSVKTISAQELQHYLAQTLPDYMVPSFFVFLKELPVTSAGKRDLRTLPLPDTGNHSPVKAPKTHIEEKLVQVWADELGVEQDRVGMDSNFFELGGHSLKANLLIYRIYKEFNVKMTMLQVFREPTVRAMVVHITTAGKEKYNSINPVSKRDYYPLSSAQRRLFFLQQMEPKSTSYNMTLVLPLREKGKRQKKRLENALKQLLQRHESLRTSIIMKDNEPIQVIADPGEIKAQFELEIVKTKKENIKEEQTFIRELVRPFDLGQAPLMRSLLIQRSGKSDLWMVDIHHIVSDGTSQAILAEDFLSLYHEQRLKPLRLQYRDFSQWQNQELKKGQLKSQQEYWLNLYSGEIPRLQMPVDFTRPKVFTFNGSHYTFSLDSEKDETRISKGIQKIGLEYGATLYMTLLAAINTLFFKYTGQQDVIIGSGIAGRPHPDLQKIIGMFVNTLAIRNYPTGEKTFGGFLKEVIRNSINAFDNQDVQFEELVDQLDPERDPSRNPLFDVSMVVQNFRKVRQGLSEKKNKNKPKGFELSIFKENHNEKPFQNPTSKFDITFFIQEITGGILIDMEYYTGIFESGTITQLATHLKRILKQVNQDPEIKLKDIEIISQEEKHRMCVEWNTTFAETPKNQTIHQLIEKQVKKTPHTTALQYMGHSISYRQLDLKANQLANYLIKQKEITPNQVVGIMMNRNIFLIIAITGILKTGGAYTPILPVYPEERIRHMIDDAGIQVVISQKKYIKKLNRLQWQSRYLNSFLCMDSWNVHSEEEEEKNELMDKKLWEYIGDTTQDEITGGGWVSSYTGKPFTKEEMDEYGDNVLIKLEPYLHKEMRVLEIGCASGITMYQIASRVGFYYGTDLSSSIIQRNRMKISKEGIHNIKLACLPAHQIDQLTEKSFDIIILNSVIQSFHGHNYLRKVIKKIIRLMAGQRKTRIFIGDIMDNDLRQKLIQDMEHYKRKARASGESTRTKTDWTSELFVSREFFLDLRCQHPEILAITFSKKIHTLENELTKYRYDALLTIEKHEKEKQEITSLTGINNLHHKKGTLIRNKSQEDQWDLQETSYQHPGNRGTPMDPAYIIYTSGTTGKPRGVIIRHSSLVNYSSWAKEQYQTHATSLFPLYTSISFDLTVTTIFLPLITGNTMVIYGEESADIPIVEIFQKGETNVVKATPSHLKILQQGTFPGNGRIKTLIVGGEELDTRLARKITHMCQERITIYNEYGPTEATVGCMIHRYTPETDTHRDVPIGNPIQNVRIYIMDDFQNPVPINAVGEIYIGGQALLTGYLNDPGCTAERVFSDPFIQGEKIYRSGDMATRTRTGMIHFLGRRDQQVKIRGHRIEIKEIENQVLKHPDVKKAVVLAITDETGNQEQLCCYWVSEEKLPDHKERLSAATKKEEPQITKITPIFKSHLHNECQDKSKKDLEKNKIFMHTNTEKDRTDIKEYLLRNLPSYMVPNNYFELEQIPLTPNGKLDQKALPKPQSQLQETHNPIPTRKSQRLLQSIWSEILGLDENRINMDVSFFELGGHSLKATILAMKIQKEFQVRIPLAEIFEKDTIRKLDGYITNAMKTHYESIPVAEKKECYPLSSAQKRIYIQQQMELNYTSYNMPFIMELEDKPQITELQYTFRRLLDRHESLRTSFRMRKNEIVQVIKEKVAFKVQKLPNERENKSPAQVYSEFVKPFDLTSPPLIRVGVSTLKERKYILMIDMHHIISDGISQHILARDFEAISRGRRLTPLKIQYKDYSEWQNRQREMEHILEQEQYWLNEYKEGVFTLHLPVDYEGTHIQNHEGDTQFFKIEKEDYRRLKEIATGEQSTLFIVMFAVYAAFLFRICQQETIVVGIPIAGRKHLDLTTITGMFVNVLPIKININHKETFNELIRRVKQKTLEAFENQDYPYDELVRKLDIPRETSRDQLTETHFVWENLDIFSPKPGEKNESLQGTVPEEGSGIHPQLLNHKTARLDLAFIASEKRRAIECQLDYRTRLFNKKTIDRFEKQYLKIIKSVITDTGIPLEEIDLLTLEQKKKLEKETGKHRKIFNELKGEDFDF